MEAQNFRIGNYITDQFGEVCTVDSINPQEIFNAEIGEIALYCILPIPLTEEWLLKFGFEMGENNKWENWNFGLKIYKTGDCFEFDQLPVFIFLKHVHQLQNLYFALTGEELTLSK